MNLPTFCSLTQIYPRPRHLPLVPVQAYKPMHNKGCRSSPLSASSTNQNYRGFLNLLACLMVAVNFNYIIANIQTYGILFSLPSPSNAAFLSPSNFNFVPLVSKHYVHALLLSPVSPLRIPLMHTQCKHSSCPLKPVHCEWTARILAVHSSRCTSNANILLYLLEHIVIVPSPIIGIDLL